jgi:hypothetical protein
MTSQGRTRAAFVLGIAAASATGAVGACGGNVSGSPSDAGSTDSGTDTGRDSGGSDGGVDAGSSCAAAGGQCVLSDSVCAVPASLACPSAPFAQFCCLHMAGSCGQPAVTTLSGCDAGGPVCQGTPGPPELNGIPADADLGPDEPDAWFPKGCTFTYPVCGNLGVYTCTCGSGWDCMP